MEISSKIQIPRNYFFRNLRSFGKLENIGRERKYLFLIFYTIADGCWGEMGEGEEK